ncbi:hypothetical protein CLF_107405 [Clonorchis sinensis]|uniref:Uncharacterized protein n=1 Tax=Clonorchis sinensis TaxID=79923 RepID=G7YQK3_CLOSI|nr:hypothetical protein CLF_107405 [Clonorchis sinensis]
MLRMDDVATQKFRENKLYSSVLCCTTNRVFGRAAMGAKWHNSYEGVTGISKFPGSFRSVIVEVYEAAYSGCRDVLATTTRNMLRLVGFHLALLCNIARNEGEISRYPAKRKTYRFFFEFPNHTQSVPNNGRRLVTAYHVLQNDSRIGKLVRLLRRPCCESNLTAQTTVRLFTVNTFTISDVIQLCPVFTGGVVVTSSPDMSGSNKTGKYTVLQPDEERELNRIDSLATFFPPGRYIK